MAFRQTPACQTKRASPHEIRVDPTRGSSGTTRNITVNLPTSPVLGHRGKRLRQKHWFRIPFIRRFAADSASRHPSPIPTTISWRGPNRDVILVDQSPIGRTPRSNPVTYLKIFDEIRLIFAATTEAKIRRIGPDISAEMSKSADVPLVKARGARGPLLCNSWPMFW